MEKAIILSGGSGTRLWPLTIGTSKQMLPIFSKPMIYYPLATLMLAGIRNILIITTPEDNDSFKRLLGDGHQFGIHLSYAVQEKPEGLAQAFLIANNVGFLKENEACALILGDNLFYSSNFTTMLKQAKINTENTITLKGESTVFGIGVKDPERYGIAEIDDNGKCLSIVEKPKFPKSNICVTGLYFYPDDILEKAKKVVPSERGELEITSINQMYLAENRLRVTVLPKGAVWLDTGTFDSLSEASGFVEAIEKRSGTMVCCPEEIAYNNEWISKEQLIQQGNLMAKNEYGQYLLNMGK